MKYFILLIISFLALLNIYGQQTSHKYIKEINYLLYLPDDYENDTLKKWPLLIFLHGSGATGNDTEKIKQGGIPLMIEDGKKFPFIVLAPQSAQHGWNAKDMHDLLINEIHKYRVNPDCIYLTGLSMGGSGTLELAITYPEYFAAIIPICASPNNTITNNIFQLRHTPVWCFHGDKDEYAPLAHSKNIVEQVKVFNPDARLTVYPGVGHDSWTPTYNNDAVFEWMLQQKRHINKKVDIAEKRLLEYSSYKYIAPDETTIFEFTAEDGNLRVWQDGKKGMLIQPESDDIFFLDENSRQYVSFERNLKGDITGFTLYQFNNKAFGRRVP